MSIPEDIINKAKKGDSHSMQIIIDQFENMVHKMARPYSFMFPYEDLVQVGKVGIIEGINKYDSTRGALSTIIMLYIKAELIKYMKVNNDYNEMAANNLTFLDFDLDYFNVIDQRDDFNMMNLRMLSDKILGEVSKSFSERDIEIVKKRLRDQTLDSIGKEYGMTKERVRQIYEEVLKKCQEIYLKNVDDFV